jgi:hypothetical protein
MWVAYTDDQTKWAKARGVSPTSIAGGTDAGLVGDPVETTHTERTALPAEVVVALENTRATSLSWPAPARRRFTDELRHHLCDHPTVPLTQETSLAMAPVATPPVGP